MAATHTLTRPATAFLPPATTVHMPW